MFKLRKKTGAALFMVLGVLLIVIILANVVLAIVLSQTRLTKHQTDRIKAYYASMAGIVLTMEQLRTNAWPCPPWGAGQQFYCVGPSCATTNPNHRVIDADLPFDVNITIPLRGEAGCPDALPIPANGRCITAQTTYTYQQ